MRTESHLNYIWKNVAGWIEDLSKNCRALNLNKREFVEVLSKWCWWQKHELDWSKHLSRRCRRDRSSRKSSRRIEKKLKNLDGSRMYQGFVKQTKRSEEKLDGSACFWKSIESKAKKLDRRGCVEVFVEKLSSLKKKSFSREEKYIKMNATSKLLKKRSTQHVKLSKHLSTYKQSIHRSKTHTLNKSNQFYIPKTS